MKLWREDIVEPSIPLNALSSHRVFTEALQSLRNWNWGFLKLVPSRHCISHKSIRTLAPDLLLSVRYFFLFCERSPAKLSGIFGEA